MNGTRFKVNVPKKTINDLRRRLEKTRWPGDFANEQWAYGTNLDYLKHLVGYWIDGYDWSRQQQTMNEYAHYQAIIEGIPIHFIREPGKGSRPVPLILSHGWPWTFWDYEKVIRPLADPA